VRRTLDGGLILNHDGMIERLTYGMGDVEQSYFEQLSHLDAVSWMGTRFVYMRIPRLTDALAVAREQEIGLMLDLKSKRHRPGGSGFTEREGMLERVRFGGECADIKALYPTANEDAAASIETIVTREQVEKLHQAGKIVIANFSANSHKMDLPAMRSAAAAGVDWINVDYPRLGADAGIRAAAALALARHQPDVAADAIPKALVREEASIAKEYSAYAGRGKPPPEQVWCLRWRA
jgi:glycerophosphoryl diester phosphodiesterase